MAAGAIAVSALVALWLTDRWVVRMRLLELEDESARRHFHVVEQALAREAHALAVLHKDWAYWDDTYAFMEHMDPEYIKSNLVAQTFVDAGLSAIIFYDQRGVPLWRGAYDREGNPTPDLDDFPPDAPPRLAGLLHSGQNELAQRVGLLSTAAGPALVASSAILPTENNGPPRGTLIMLRRLDAPLLATLRQSTATDFALAHASDERTGVRVRRMDADKLRVDGELVDALGAPSIRLTADLPRAAFQRQRAASLSFAWVMGGIVFGSFALLLCAIRGVVIKPILGLAAHTERIRHSGDFSLRIGPMRTNEFNALASQFDTLMSEVERRSDELHRLALIDPLTGALNRRAFDLQLERIWADHSERGTPLTLILCDVDHFKHYNSRYGHPAGDRCLVALVTHLLDAAKPLNGGLFRLGGDEFALVIPNAGVDAAGALAEKFRAGVEALRMPHSGVAVSRYVTLSVGTASCVPTASTHFATMLELADQALYQAKHGGRNRAQPI